MNSEDAFELAEVTHCVPHEASPWQPLWQFTMAEQAGSAEQADSSAQQLACAQSSQPSTWMNPHVPLVHPSGVQVAVSMAHTFPPEQAGHVDGLQ